MTRFASIMGVAAVATLVLLSGCEAVMDKTDYVKDLEGTWTVSDLPAMAVPPGETTPRAATANVSAMITAGEKLNTGEVSLMVTTTVPDFPVAGQSAALPPITATGSIVVDSKNIEVTIDEISVSIGDPPAAAAALEGQEYDIGYTVTDDTLEVSSPLFQTLGIAESITLTKSAAQ